MESYLDGEEEKQQSCDPAAALVAGEGLFREGAPCDSRRRSGNW